MGLKSCKNCSPRVRLDWGDWVLDGFHRVEFNRECGRNFVWKQQGPFDEYVIEKNIESIEGSKKIYKHHGGGSGGGGSLGGGSHGGSSSQ